MRATFRSFVMVLALALVGCASPVTLTDVATVNRPGRHEVYLPGSGVTLGGILFRSDNKATAVPAIVVLQAGRLPCVRRASRVEGTARRLSEQGYVSLALSMRGWPPSDGRDDCGSEQPNDIVRAADWLAGLPGVNPDRIGVLGNSQGGQVALLSGARTSRIKAIVAVYAVTDIPLLRTTTSHESVRRYYTQLTCGAGYENSPVNFAGNIQAPVLLIHGDSDTRVPTEQSLKMQDALRTANRPVEFVLVPGAGHGFTGVQSQHAWSATMRFFSTHLGLRD